jgi:predicted HAD superfamily Cof-like phosphohydrolase
MKPYDDVRGFANATGNADPVLYARLVDEEYDEFVDAVTDEHKLQEAMDLVWVTLGYCIVRGWDVPGAWDELTRANMKKIQVDPVTGELKRRADGKIMKPEGWKKPDFSPYVNGHNSSPTKE